MNKIHQCLLYLGLIFLGLCIGWYISDNRRIQVPETVFIRDTFKTEIPKPVIEYVPILVNVDTAAILAMYFSKLTYTDTIINYPELKVSLTDVISQNTLSDRLVFVDYTKPEKPTYNAISAGMDLSAFCLPVYLSYRRKRMTYKVGYDLFNKAPLVGFSVDLWQW